MNGNMDRKFIILDFGSQYTWLLARCFRELGYPCEVMGYDTPFDRLKKINPLGFILSGGPHSVFAEKAPKRSVSELASLAPCLGICYGMQLIGQNLGGRVESSKKGGYGHNIINWKRPLLKNLKEQKVWMSHGDVVQKLPPQMEPLAYTREGVLSAFRSKENNIWAFQFHPEVEHTDKGKHLIREFAQSVCKAEPGKWNTDSMLASVQDHIRKTLPKNEKVLCALSGGVDSTITAVLLHRILGKNRVQCLFVDTGLLRLNEFEEVLDRYKKLNLNIKGIQAQDAFLSALKGVTDPEEKRKIIGRVFIEVFKKYKDPDIGWLAQGTIYPDVIESFSPQSLSAVIKSHHNVGGLPQKLGLKLLEPVRFLFKDEIRVLGKKLEIEDCFLNRHPFPGPGLAIRILGEVNRKNVEILQQADSIFIEEIIKQGLYTQIWQAFCVLLSSRSVGVQGDQRTYEKTIALRAVTSTDAMTADWFGFSDSFLKTISNKITNQIRSINRVVYDITSKPPGTIEWE